MAKATYDESNIKVYKGLEAIRRKPGMYLGEMGDNAIRSCAKELFDNVLDEFQAGRNKTGKLTVIDDGTVLVADESCGMPVGLNKELNISTLTALFTQMHAGGKFDNKAFKVSAGCFVGDTKLRLLDNTLLSFEQLYHRWQEDQTPLDIASYDLTTGRHAVGHITHVQLSKYVTDIARVNLSDGSIIESTVDHPYYVQTLDGIAKVPAANLQPAMRLLVADGETMLVVIACEVVSLPLAVPVYGLTVDPYHVYRIEPGHLVANTHGVGLKGCTALCDQLDVWTFRESVWYHQQFSQGKIVTEVTKKKPPADVQNNLPSPNKKGTIIRWTPDLTIIGKNAKPPFAEIRLYLENLALLNKGFRVAYRTLIKGKDKTEEFHNTVGPAAYLDALRAKLKVKLEGKPLLIETENLDLALSLTDYDEDNGVKGYVTSSLTIDGGKHLDGFWSALTKALGEQANRKHKYQPKDLRYGLVGYINLRVSGPKFSSQTKEKLVGFEVEGETKGQLIPDRQLELEKPEQAIHQFIYPLLLKQLAKNKEFAKAVLDRATQVSKAREQSKELMKAASKLKVKDKHDPLPEVLYPATKAPPHERELYLVEGDSAGGCLTFDTQVMLADGSIKTFAELVEGEAKGHKFHTKSWDTKQKCQEVGFLDTPRITKYVTELVEVELSDGTVVRCTPDHPFLLDDGSTYVAAESLVPGQVLQVMPDN